jgi:hypothetical protein
MNGESCNPYTLVSSSKNCAGGKKPASNIVPLDLNAPPNETGVITAIISSSTDNFSATEVLIISTPVH